MVVNHLRTGKIVTYLAKLEKVKKESSERVNKVREETAKALEKMGKAIKKEETKQ